MTPEHEPEADSGERPNTTQKALEAQMQAAAAQIKKTKESISPDLLATVNEGTVTFARLAAEVGRGFAGSVAAAEDFGEGMAEVNRIIDEEDE